MIYEYFTDIFPYEKFPVEYECYKQLKDYKDLNYIAIPWTQIMNSTWLNFPGRQHRDYYFRILSKEKIQQHNNFTICQHDSYMDLQLYFKHFNITKVFSPLHDTANAIDGIEIIPIPFTSNFNFDQTTKDILFSFVGTYTSHTIREKMKNRIIGENIIYRNSYHIDDNTFGNINSKEKEEIEYRNILQRSRYSLCPRGSSPSSVRFWESLQAGAIPILISDNWMLPDWDWSNTIIHIKETDFDKMTYKDIKALLDNITPINEQQMRANCIHAYSSFKKENFTNYIRKYIIK